MQRQKSQFSKIEEDLLATWEKEETFQKSVKNRRGQPRFVFNDGPPFANGLPHFGHSLVTGVKDSILRYKTMRGMYVPRRNGWDCHGLPVEFDIEKQLNISGKKQILELGIDKFNAACRDSIFRYKGQWEEFLKRYGRWSDYNRHYATVDRDYTESVWWILSQINQKGLLYKGFKSLPYCPRCETPLSNFELNEGYRDNVPDPSVFALFPLQGDPNTKLLAWTTTPWTLPANAALAVDKEADYAYVQLKSDNSTLVLAKDRLDTLDLRQTDYSLLKIVKGAELVGQAYLPLYPLPAGKFSEEQVKAAHRIYADDSVSLEDGTGILHVAPRYGETDLNLGQRENLPLIESVDSSGHIVFPKNVAEQFFKEADPHIIAELTQAGRLFAAETTLHTYPFCWRCDTPLMYFATTTWFVEVTKVKDRLLKTAEEISWTPANIKQGRFGKWLEGARDWAISRNRYWGAPMPIWVNVDNPDDYIIVGSIAELEKLAGKEVVQRALGTDGAQGAGQKRTEAYRQYVEGVSEPATQQPAGSAGGAAGSASRQAGASQDSLDLHRPFIDEITFGKDGKTYKRVEEVLDCWFESGSMPLAQWHYPFENKEEIDQLLTADFITEGLDQTRLWFYVQHVISTIIFDKPAYKNVIATGIVTAADGQKLSKRLRNYPPTEEVFDREGADAWRLYLLSSVQATETADYLRFRRDAVTDLQRNVLGTLYNSFRFFKTYSDLDKWQATGLQLPASSNILDQWILARLEQVVTASTKSADNFKIAHAIEPLFELVDDLSNWYIRRSRRRFWKPWALHRTGLPAGGAVRTTSASGADSGLSSSMLSHSSPSTVSSASQVEDRSNIQMQSQGLESDKDKQQAYATLYYVLMRCAQLLAPWAPFLPDYIWRELRAGNMPESVHLSDWPSVKEPDNTSTKLLEEMTKVRELITEGLAQRAEAKYKVRQPLQSAIVNLALERSSEFTDIIADELNVKEVKWENSTDLNINVAEQLNVSELIKVDTTVTPELKSEGIARDLVRLVQSARKKAGFNVEDRINLSLSSDSADITEAINEFKQRIYAETLTIGELPRGDRGSYSEDAQLEGHSVKVALGKA